jgi:ribosomal protein L7/L12
MDEHERRVATLMQQGRKIEAIAALREATGMGLADAKAAVERLAEGQPLPAQYGDAPVEPSEEVRRLAAAGQTIEAIRRLREDAGISLQEAKRVVDTVPLEPGARRSGCAGSVLIALTGLSCALLR